jgi:hypothetical protein
VPYFPCGRLNLDPVDGLSLETRGRAAPKPACKPPAAGARDLKPPDLNSLALKSPDFFPPPPLLNEGSVALEGPVLKAP